MRAYSAGRIIGMMGLVAALAACGVNPGAGEGTCTAGVEIGPVQHLGLSTGMPPLLGAAVQASRERVLYNEAATFSQGANAATDLEVFSANATSGNISQLTRDNIHTLLLDASGDDLLVAESFELSLNKPWRLWLKGPGGAKDLGQYTFAFPLGHQGTVSPPRQQMNSGRAAWAAADAIYLYDGQVVHKVAAVKGNVDGPYLEGSATVWAASDGQDWEVFLHAGGKVSQLTNNSEDDRHPVVGESGVYWLCGEDICQLKDGVTQKLDSGPCQPPAAHGHQAAWICDNQVILHRVEGSSQLVTREDNGLELAGLRLAKGLLVWAEIADKVGKTATGLASLMISDGGESTLKVADVGLGCLMCCALWPSLKISFSGDVLAWSYPLQNTASPSPGSAMYPAMYAYTTVKCK